MPSAKTTLTGLALAGGAAYLHQNGLPDVVSHLPSMPDLSSYAPDLSSYVPDMSSVASTAGQWAGNAKSLASEYVPSAQMLGAAASSVGSTLGGLKDTASSYVPSSFSMPSMATVKTAVDYGKTAASIAGLVGTAAKLVVGR